MIGLLAEFPVVESEFTGELPAMFGVLHGK